MGFSHIGRNIAKVLSPESDDFLHLDVLRFVAAASIVVFHFRHSLSGVGDAVSGLSYMVDLFFIISGVIMASVYRTRLNSLVQYKIFLQRRVARLVPLHWALLVIFILIAVICDLTGIKLNDADKYDTACIIPNLLLVHAFNTCSRLTFNFVSWSISAEMAMYVLLPLFLLLARQSWRLLLLTVGAVIALEMWQNPLHPWYQRTFDWGVLRAIPAFAYGLFLYYQRMWLAALPFASSITVALVLLFFTIMSFVSGGYMEALSYLIVTAAVAADKKAQTPLWVRRCAGLGQLTYSSYMLHPLVYTLAVPLMADSVLHLTGWIKTLWVIAAMFMVVPLSIASIVLFEAPLRRKINAMGR